MTLSMEKKEEKMMTTTTKKTSEKKIFQKKGCLREDMQPFLGFSGVSTVITTTTTTETQQDDKGVLVTTTATDTTLSAGFIGPAEPPGGVLPSRQRPVDE